MALGPGLVQNPLLACLAMLCVFSGTCSGFLFNEVKDEAIDARIKPYRPIPNGALSVATARRSAIALYVAAALCAVASLTQTRAGLFLIAFVIIGIFYTPIKYRFGIVKEIYVATCFTLPVLFALTAQGSAGRLWPLAAGLFFFLVYRELAMDAHDQIGDRLGGIRSLPMILRPQLTEFGLCLTWSAAMIFPVLTDMETWKRLVWLGLIFISLWLFIWALLPARPSDWRRLTWWMWLPMAGVTVLFL